MQINYDGIVRDMTPEEVQKYKALMQEQSQNPTPPTEAERLAALEEELRAAKILLGLEV